MLWEYKYNHKMSRKCNNVLAPHHTMTCHVVSVDSFSALNIYNNCFKSISTSECTSTTMNKGKGMGTISFSSLSCLFLCDACLYYAFKSSLSHLFHLVHQIDFKIVQITIWYIQPALGSWKTSEMPCLLISIFFN